MAHHGEEADLLARRTDYVGDVLPPALPGREGRRQIDHRHAFERHARLPPSLPGRALLLRDLYRLLDDAMAILPTDEIDVEAIGLTLRIEAIAAHQALIIRLGHGLAQLLRLGRPGALDRLGDDVHLVVARCRELGGGLVEALLILGH